MSTFLLKLLELSLQAGVLTIAILLVRLLFRKFPAKYLCLLWAIVAVRLIIPFSIETGFAWAPNVRTLWSEKENNIYGVLVDESVYDADGNLVDYVLNGSTDTSGNIGEIYAELISEKIAISTPDNEMDEEGNYFVISPTQIPEGSKNVTFRMDWQELFTSITPTLFVLWLLGMVLLMGYGAFSCFKVKRLVRNAIPYEENIWLCDGLKTPFLFGWIHPQIYLPTNLEEDRMKYVILHEKAHIARGDNYFKLVGYVLLAVYWFNPLIWVAYVAFCKDVERACDERVIDGLDGDGRKSYAEALLECSVDRKFTISNPLAFGEMDVKKRITGILKYKKPGRWLIAIAMLLCVVAVAGCFFIKEKRPTLVMGPSPTPTSKVTAAPTPTVAPTNPPRGDGPYTPTPTQAEANMTPTPLPPSDLTLLGNCTKETVLPVPFGRTVSVDLNGDGLEEAVTFGLEGYEGDISIDDLRKTQGADTLEKLYYLKIDERVFYQPEIAEEFWESSGVGNTSFYIFDVNTSDKFKEIGIYFPGPNTPTGVALFRYVEDKLHCVGNFMSEVLTTDRGYSNYLTYNELVTQVKREGYEISVPGDGTILCRERRDMLETAFSVRKYELYNASYKYAKLQRVDRERYELLGWQKDNSTSAKAFTAYLTPVDMSQEFHKDLLLVKIPEGTRTAFYAFYPDNGWTTGWVQFAYGDNLDKFAWFYKGVDATGRFMIYLPDATERSVEELFDNLNHAG